MKKAWLKDPIVKNFNKEIKDLPVSSNVSSFWNLGFLMGFTLVFQIITGFFLSVHYIADVDSAFYIVNSHISHDVWFGWMLRNYHASAASMLFICMYIHIGRAMYFGSYSNFKAWFTGVIMMVFLMAIALLGYVLVWGQMSYWAATVITNLFTAIPYLGQTIAFYVWGDYSVSSATLSRFFSFHFVLPYVLAAFSISHVIYIHEKGSSNPLGVNSDSFKVPLHQYFTIKDFMLLVSYFMVMSILVFFFPNLMSDPENFMVADPLTTPAHIKPEFYFLWAYAILRSVPSKLGGVVLLGFSIVVLASMPFFNKSCPGCVLSPVSQVLFWCWVSNFIFLSYVGSCPVEAPYEVMGQISTFFYFFYFFIDPIVKKMEKKFLEL